MANNELKNLVKENLELTKENNEILKKIRRGAIWGRVFRVLYWIVILGAMFGAYYILQPFMDKLIEAYNNLMGGVENVQNIGNSLPDFSSLFDKFQSSK